MIFIIWDLLKTILLNRNLKRNNHLAYINDLFYCILYFFFIKLELFKFQNSVNFHDLPLPPAPIFGDKIQDTKLNIKTQINNDNISSQMTLPPPPPPPPLTFTPVSKTTFYPNPMNESIPKPPSLNQQPVQVSSSFSSLPIQNTTSQIETKVVSKPIGPQEDLLSAIRAGFKLRKVSERQLTNSNSQIVHNNGSFNSNNEPKDVQVSRTVCG